MGIRVRGDLAVGSAAVFTVIAASVLPLSGCTLEVGGFPVPSDSSTPEPTPQIDVGTGEPAAVMTIASVDVDGVNATVAGFVTETSEDGGECEFVLAKAADGTELSRITEGTANVRTTSCGTVGIPIEELSRGSWSVVLHYTSDALDLESDPLVMEIP